METWNQDFYLSFFRSVVVPMFKAYQVFKTMKGQESRFTLTKTILEAVGAPDWKQATMEWVSRREDKQK